MKRVLGIVLGVVVLVGLIGGGIAWFKYQSIAAVGAERAGDPADQVSVKVERGMGPMAISKRLEDKGIIKDAKAFYDYLRFVARKSAALKAGDYLLSPGMSADEIIAELETGRQQELRFTVPEGLRLEEIAEVIADSGVAARQDLLLAMKDPALVKAFGVPAVGAGGQDGVPGGIEGYLFPDTYQFAKGTPASDILKRMRERLDEVVDEQMRARMEELGWNLHKTLTLGAIIEKETGQAFERPHISSVFHNRLNKKMKLQTDPTVIYGIKGNKKNIRRADLRDETNPYNTYVIPGLPPGPIASPGLEAIKAALWPESKDDLFFVSRNDGTHIFCPTLECHEAAVQKWQVEFFRKKRRGG
jgi:UPF0755 protein